MSGSRRRALYACALAGLAAAAAYWGSLSNGFAWDDHVHIEAAPFVQDPHNARVLLTRRFWSGRAEVEGSARPALLASLLADRALWGGAPAGYHLTNLLLHAACASALAWLAWLLIGSAGAAALAGLLFALHPVQSEAVCAIMFRADPMAALGVLLALALFRLACARRSSAWAAASAAAFALALLAKETAAVFPALAALMELLFPTGTAAARSRRTAAVLFAAALLAYAVFRLPRGGYAVPPPAPGAAPPAPTKATTQFHESAPEWKAAMRDPKTRVLTMSGILGDYVRLTLWPAGLQADRSAPTVSRWSSPRAWSGWAVLILILLAAWTARTALPAAALGLCWFLVALVPASDLIPLPNLIAERYLYLSIAGAALAAAAALDAASKRFSRPRLLFLAASAALLAPAAAETRTRVPAWRDDASLFGAPVVTDSARLRYNRGLLAQRAGRLDEAQAQYRRALELNPLSVETLVNLSDVDRVRGRKKERLTLLRRAFAAAPNSTIVCDALGDALKDAGRPREALEYYSKAVGADSRWPGARRKYALALAGAGRLDEAIEESAAAVELQPDSASARYDLGRLQQRAARLSDAAATFRDAVRLDPKNGLAWANLGACLHESGDAAGALEPTKRAVALLPNSADTHRNLGAVLDDLGRLPEAEAEYETSAQLDSYSAASWHGYGVVLQQRGFFKHAEEAYMQALQTAPDKVETLVNLAGLRARDGDFDAAFGLMQRAVTVRPNDPTVRRAFDDIIRARAAAQRGK